MQGAIGYDCRRLEDGRIASFRHTGLHRRARRDFFERCDLMSFLKITLSAASSISSNPRLEFSTSMDIVQDNRMSLLKTAFPYMDLDGVEKPNENVDYDALFDELDEIASEDETASEEGSHEASPVGEGDGK